MYVIRNRGCTGGVSHGTKQTIKGVSLGVSVPIKRVFANPVSPYGASTPKFTPGKIPVYHTGIFKMAEWQPKNSLGEKKTAWDEWIWHGLAYPR